ncbi:hypothetical protein OV450_8448 [Actinobacteria bacterium OV450]|nr:hypothetical protein OV450_8448 [Actinobacteria bacterium OV450]
MLAADDFARNEKNVVIAKRLRVSVRSVERWRRSWREGGRQALCTSGPARRPKVDDSDFAVLEPLLLDGAMAEGWADERWTLSRVRMLIADQLGGSLSIRGVWSCCGGTAGRVSSLRGGQWNGTTWRWPAG